MKLNALRDFLAVAERGSLRAASRQIEVAQPAISRSIQELEKELGVVLFERRARGVSLTPMGQVFLRRARAVRSELGRAQDELAQMRGERHGQIRVCLSSASHMAVLPEVMRPFRLRYPDVRLDVVDALLPRVEGELKDGTIDCYIGPVVEDVPPELMAERLFDNTRIIVGRRGHPLARARSLRDLAEAEWLTTSIRSRSEDELGAVFADHGLPLPRTVVQAHSAFSFIFLLAYSDLLMMLPIQWVQVPLFHDALQRIEVAEALPSPPISLVQRTGLPLTPAAEYFCDLVRRASRHVSRGVSDPAQASGADALHLHRYHPSP